MTNLGIPFQPKYTTCVLFRIMLFCCVEKKPCCGHFDVVGIYEFRPGLEVPSCHGSSSPTGSVRWGLAVQFGALEKVGLERGKGDMSLRGCHVMVYLFHMNSLFLW